MTVRRKIRYSNGEMLKIVLPVEDQYNCSENAVCVCFSWVSCTVVKFFRHNDFRLSSRIVSEFSENQTGAMPDWCNQKKTMKLK